MLRSGRWQECLARDPQAEPSDGEERGESRDEAEGQWRRPLLLSSTLSAARPPLHWLPSRVCDPGKGGLCICAPASASCRCETALLLRARRHGARDAQEEEGLTNRARERRRGRRQQD